MKILHTSDWHLGHTLYGYDRGKEQRAMLLQMEEIVRKEQPDAFLLSGDVYHTAQPSSAVQTLFAESMMRLHEACPGMVIVVTAGNHDSGTRHEVFRAPWRGYQVFTLGTLDKENPENHVVELSGKGYIIAIPYANERNLPEGFFAQMTDWVGERNAAGLPVVLMAHLTLKGCDYVGHDAIADRIVGGIDAYDVKGMGEGYDYLALGHIHHGQFVHTGRHNARYSGSPLAVSFDERYAHSVSMVEIGAHGEQPKVRTIEIRNPRPLVTLPTEGAATWEEAKRLLADFPSDLSAYIRLNVRQEDFPPVEANEEATRLTEGKRCRFCCINYVRPEEKQLVAKKLTVQELQEAAPIDIARQFVEESGLEFDGEMEEIFKEVLRLTEEDARNQ